MVKRTWTIRRQMADELFMFDYFEGFGLKGLTANVTQFPTKLLKIPL